MPDPVRSLAPRLSRAIVDAFGPAVPSDDPVLRRAGAGRGDYQANFAMALGKALGRPPREIADAVVEKLDASGLCSKTEVAGPGFVNLTLEDDYLAAEVVSSTADPRLGVPPVAAPRTTVIDYGGPNVAKEMHVGHLRSAVIGDALVRTLGWLGHRVLRQDHLGDWGTQFGMLIEHLVDLGWESGRADHSIGDLNELYRQAQEKFRNDRVFADRSRRRVAALQGGDPATLALWGDLVDESRRHFEQVYRRLGVTLGPGDVRPESFYNDMLEPMVAELTAKGILRVDQGALCAFPEGFTNRDGEPQPLIVRYSAGGYGYEATDLAGVRYSVEELGADWLLYVVDARQRQHFAMVFAVARQAGWLEEGVDAVHVAFGSILGPDGKPFKTRSGETVKLIDLLDEAVQRAAAVVDARSDELDAAERVRVAEAVGVGSVKYNDLSSDRLKDEVFDWDRMLSHEGNTAPYLQYAHARIRSIFRRGGVDFRGGGAGALPPVILSDEAERGLALQLLGFDGAVQATAEHLAPHRLCGYLFETATAFTTFYERCPVLRAPDEAVRDSRLVLCELTARTLSTGLGLVGIDAPPRM